MLRFDLSKKLNIPIKWLPGENSGVIRSVSFIKTLTCFKRCDKHVLIYCTFNISGRYSCLWEAVILLYIWLFVLALLDFFAAFFCMIAPLLSPAGFKRDSLNFIRLLRVVIEGETTRSNRMNFRLQKREHFSNRAAIAAILMERLTWEAGVGFDKHLYLNGWQ